MIIEETVLHLHLLIALGLILMGIGVIYLTQLGNYSKSFKYFITSFTIGACFFIGYLQSQSIFEESKENSQWISVDETSASNRDIMKNAVWIEEENCFLIEPTMNDGFCKGDCLHDENSIEKPWPVLDSSQPRHKMFIR